jgi:putative transposase
MSRYNQASHVFWKCQYHIVWTPKYRFRLLKNNVGKEVYRCINVNCNQLGCGVVELTVQIDHVHLVVKVPPKLSISKLMGVLKGKISCGSITFDKGAHTKPPSLEGGNLQ